MSLSERIEARKETIDEQANRMQRDRQARVIAAKAERVPEWVRRLDKNAKILVG